MPHSAHRKPSRIAFKLPLAAGACLVVLSIFGSTSALAARGTTSAPAPTSGSGAGCEGQIFTEPFALFGDFAKYMLVPGSQFNTAGEGWEFSGGAQITETVRPFGLRGDALELPSGAEAESPPVCVNMTYETAKVWIKRINGSGRLKVSVSYAGTRSENRPVKVAAFRGGPSWSPEAFEVEPGLAPGEPEEAREVRFIFSAAEGGSTDFQLYGVYVDPRML